MIIKRFNESIDFNISLIEEAFMDISDDYTMEIEPKVKNLYMVNIEVPLVRNECITSISEIDSEVSSYSELSKVMLKIRQALARVKEYEKFSIMIYNFDGHSDLSVIIDFGGDSSFYSLDNLGILKISKIRIKSVLKNKFDLELHNIKDDYNTTHDGIFIELDFEDLEEINESDPKIEKMIEFLMKDETTFYQYSIIGSSLIIYTTQKVSDIKII